MDVFIATQPIFNHKKQIYAYKLLHAGKQQNTDVVEAQNSEDVVSDVLLTAFNNIGLGKLTAGNPVYVSFIQNLIDHLVATLFPADKLFIEIPSDCLITQSLHEKLKQLKNLGYSIVLNDSPCSYEIAELADIIQVDIVNKTESEINDIVIRFEKNRKIKLMAKNVQTTDIFEYAQKTGFHLFQGDFFSKPVIHSSTDIAPLKMNYLMLINKINMGSMDYKEVAAIISRDVSLSYNILKLLNSVAFGLRTRVTSIKHALALLGEDEFKKWMSLIALREIGNDKPNELMRVILIRAKFLEILANNIGLGHRSSDLFLMGLLSMLDVFMNRPIKEILSGLPINTDIINSLVSHEGPLKSPYLLVCTYEKGNWEIVDHICEKLKVSSLVLPDIHFNSILWG